MELYISAKFDQSGSPAMRERVNETGKEKKIRDVTRRKVRTAEPHPQKLSHCLYTLFCYHVITKCEMKVKIKQHQPCNLHQALELASVLVLNTDFDNIPHKHHFYFFPRLIYTSVILILQ